MPGSYSFKRHNQSEKRPFRSADGLLAPGTWEYRRVKSCIGFEGSRHRHR